MPTVNSGYLQAGIHPMAGVCSLASFGVNNLNNTLLLNLKPWKQRVN